MRNLENPNPIQSNIVNPRMQICYLWNEYIKWDVNKIQNMFNNFQDVEDSLKIYIPRNHK